MKLKEIKEAFYLTCYVIESAFIVGGGLYLLDKLSPQSQTIAKVMMILVVLSRTIKILDSTNIIKKIKDVIKNEW